MAYIGNTATTQAFTPAVDYFNGDGATVAFTLSKPVASVAQVQAVIENVPQNPGSAYTVSGNTITFTSAPPSGTSNIYVYYTSPITQVIAPSQGTVGTEQIKPGTIGIGGTSSQPAELQLFEDTDNGTNFVAIKAPASVASNLTLTLPSADGTSGQALTTNGSGVLAFSTIGGAANVQTFDTSGTWTKPTSGSVARVQMWGGGGGGARNTTTLVANGGGGGGYNELTVPLSYLASSVSITVGAGGAGRTASAGSGTVGGTTSVPFASYPGGAATFYAYGGGGGGTSYGGGGGGLLSAGATNGLYSNPGLPWSTIVYDTLNTYNDVFWCGGRGGDNALSGDTTGAGFVTVWGGCGGALGGGTNNYTGGTPVYGGKGGNGGRVTSGFDGTIPAGGGGGRNNNLDGGNGAAGRVIITVW